MTIQETDTIVVRAPRRPWMEFLLHFGTFGLYTFFWFVKRVRELNILSDNSFKPWLWFFVPSSIFVQLFALPKFTSAITKLEKEHDIQPWKKSTTGFWMFCVFSSTIFSKIGNKIELPGWSYFLILLAWSLLFSILQVRINRYKNAIENLAFEGSEKNYSVLEWLGLVFLLPIVLIGLGYLAINPLLNYEVKKLEQNSVYTDPKGHYQFPILTDGWSIVNSGAISDGTAELELQGPLTDMNFIVFFYAFGEDLNTLSYSRINFAKEALNFASCTETRDFAKARLSINSRTICTGSILTDKALIISSIIETEKGIYELFGQFSSVKLSFNQQQNDYIKMAAGFEPL